MNVTIAKALSRIPKLFETSITHSIYCMVVILLTVTLYMRLILVPRASRPRASSLGPGTHGTGSTRKLAVISKVARS